MGDRKVIGWARKGAFYASQDPDIFVSYSSAQVAVARQVVQILESKGLVCWCAPRDVRPTCSYLSEIVRGLDGCKLLLLLLTPQSINSPHVQREVRHYETKGRPILAMQLADCNPGRLLRPSSHVSVCRFKDWDLDVDDCHELADDLIAEIKQASDLLRVRLMEEAKMSALRQQDRIDLKQIVSQAMEGMQRRNDVSFGRPKREDRIVAARDRVGQNRSAMRETIASALILHGATPQHDISKFQARLNTLGVESQVVGADDSEFDFSALQRVDAVIAVFDHVSIKHRKILAILEQAVSKKCLGILATRLPLPAELVFLFATEHILHAKDGSLADLADTVHFHLQHEPGAEAKDVDKRGLESGPGTVVATALCLSGFAAVLAVVGNSLLSTSFAPWTWARNVLLLCAVLSPAILFGQWIAKKEAPYFLPTKERFENDMVGSVAAAVLAAFLLAVSVLWINWIFGTSISYMKTVYMLGAMFLLIVFPVTISKHFQKIKRLETTARAGHQQCDDAGRPQAEAPPHEQPPAAR